MRTITIITSALLFGTGLALIISLDQANQLYKELGIVLPGMTETVLDLHSWHADYLLLVLAVGWMMKERLVAGMRYRKALAIAGLVVAILLPLLVALVLLLPLVKLTETIGAPG
ncbi:MAG: hypothetical protein H0X38_11665 [Planctomycetes bacterium]|nr:hypothetical protein [Planctomycetota bacterium]